jgi:hypothetical protein
MKERPYHRSFRALALAVSLCAASGPIATGQVPAEPLGLQASFTPGIDASAWYWTAGDVPVLGELLPSPSGPDTLPVGVTAGEPDRMSALRFALDVRGLASYSTVLSGSLRIEEGSGSGDQPPFQPELARLKACPIDASWSEGVARPAGHAPPYSAAGCVGGVRQAGGPRPAWVFDVSSMAGPWGELAIDNHGVMLIGDPAAEGVADTWQVNLDRRAASLSLTYLLPPPPSDGYPAAGDTTGISPETIRIGLHASVTGSAPVRADSFNTGKDLYWLNGQDGGPVAIFGRAVQVSFRDDQSSPSTALARCRDLIEEGVFLIVGAGGAETTAACAAHSAQEGVPYVSLGNTEKDLRAFRNYFALSASYAQQGPALAAHVKQAITTDPTRVAVIAFDVPTLDDAVAGFTDGLPGAEVIRPPRTSRGSEYADELCAGVLGTFDAVYVLASPTFFLELEGSASCSPRFVGVGMTMGLDVLAGVGCDSPTGSMEGSLFFSPAPAFADAALFDQAFLDAGGKDDIELILWGAFRSLRAMLEGAGPDPDRRGFVDAAEELNVETGLFPALAFSRQEHLGARQAHLLRAVCEGGEGHYITERPFVGL